MNRFFKNAIGPSLILAGICVVLMMSMHDKRPGRAREPATPAGGVQTRERIEKAAEQPRDKEGIGSRGDTIQLPFLGRVECYSKPEVVEVPLDQGGHHQMPFRVSVDKNKHFLRADFLKDGTKNNELPLRDLEEAILAGGERIVSLSQAPPAAPWQKVIGEIAKNVDIERVTQMSITYVVYDDRPDPVRPTFIVHVFGAPFWWNDKNLLRVRFLLNSDGTIKRFDNAL